jgi:carbamoyltransferase
MALIILGLSAFYHDSAAVLLVDGELVAAAQEERFSRVKHDERFPHNAVRYCLTSQNIALSDIDYVVFYDKPLLKFERILETYISYAPIGLKSFAKAMPVWLKDKLFLKKTLRSELAEFANDASEPLPKLLFTDHHQSHAASAFFPSPFEKAAVLCIDGVGEWATTSLWVGSSSSLNKLSEIRFPHSLGLLYSAFTYYCGFKVNSGEYKLMGLAPYGRPKYVDLIRSELIDIKEDGSFRLNMSYFDYATGLKMTNRRFDGLFGGKARKPGASITQKEMDIAQSIQCVTEEVVLKLARYARDKTGESNLCLAGGVALNCVANGKLLQEGIFDSVWIQPAAGDAGGAIGAALSGWYEYLEKERPFPDVSPFSQKVDLGPVYSNSEIVSFLDNAGVKYQDLGNYQSTCKYTANALSKGSVVGWFQGGMEFGPRALGNRSILGDPRGQYMQRDLNLKIKQRESFRPFAPAIKAEKAADWFDIEQESPYMLFTAAIADNQRNTIDKSAAKLIGSEGLSIQRSSIPAVTHVDYSARVQTVSSESNLVFWTLLDEFEKLTACPVLINTSFNVRGEPIVCNIEDAFRCFVSTDLDLLVLGSVIVKKSDMASATINAYRHNKPFAMD